MATFPTSIIPPCIKNPLAVTSLEQCLYNGGESSVRYQWTMALSLVAVFSIIVYSLYATYLMITSFGDPQKVEEAKKIFLYCFIALVIVILAGSIVTLFKSMLINGI